MKTGIDEALLESGNIIKRTHSALLENAGKTIALITGIVAVLVTFTEIGFYDLRTVGFISEALILIVASYIIYFSLVDSGERLGRESEEFRECAQKYEKALSEIRKRDVSRLRSFLWQYSEEELEFRRRAALLRYGIGYSDFLSYLNGESIPKKYRKAIRRVKRIKPYQLSPKLLFSKERTNGKGELYNPERGHISRLAISLIPSTVCMIFTVSVMLGMKDEMSAEFVIESILKLSALPIIGLRGYSAGYKYATGELVLWIRTKTTLIETFLNMEKDIPES